MRRNFFYLVPPLASTDTRDAYRDIIYLSVHLFISFIIFILITIIFFFFFLHEIQPDQLVRYRIRYVITIGGQTYGRARSDIYVDRETLDWITFSVGGQRRYPDHRHEYVLVSRFWQRIGSVRSAAAIRSERSRSANVGCSRRRRRKRRWRRWRASSVFEHGSVERWWKREGSEREREKEADVFASVSKRTQVHFVGRVRRDARNVPILVRPLSTSL